MHIENIEIIKYKALKALNINLQVPEEGENTTNVIAGINGSGKTTLLEFILMHLGVRNQLINNGGIQHININIDFKSGSLTLNSFGKLIESNYLTYWNKLNQGEFKKFKLINYETGTMRNGITKTLEPLERFTNSKILNLDSDVVLGISEDFIKEYIINETLKSSISNPMKRMEKVVNDFNSFFTNVDLLSKLYTIDNHQRPVFKTNTNDLITIDQLSSGEKQLYAKVIMLKMLEPEDSIILIDEPDLTLHPKWQAEIMNLYSKIGKNNQFIITTHSPFIIAQTNYKSLIFLENNNGKIELGRLKEPPVDIDTNTILKTTMGAEYIPIKQQRLHQSYLELVENGKIDSKEAEEIKQKILKLESLNSSFFQDLFFDMELKK